MNREQIAIFIGDKSITVVDAMEKIDANSRGVLFIIDEDGTLIGCITDGDIRRWIINSGALTTSVEYVMNKAPKYLIVGEEESAVALMKKYAITAIPVLDYNKHIVDIAMLDADSCILFNKNSSDLCDVPVVIMAGGKGTRLYPYTKILPKPLIPIGETPIVERIINRFVEYGINSYYITVNYKKGMLRSYFNDLEPNYTINYVEEDKPLGTCGSIRLINNKFDKPLFVTNCDALIFANYAEIYDYHIKNENLITMVVALKNIVVPYGVVHSGENGGFICMEEKPKLSYLINTGMYVINPDVIDLIPEDTMFHMTHLIEKVMKLGGKVGTYPISEDSFLDMGEFSEMKRMEQKLNIISDN